MLLLHTQYSNPSEPLSLSLVHGTIIVLVFDFTSDSSNWNAFCLKDSTRGEVVSTIDAITCRVQYRDIDRCIGFDIIQFDFSFADQLLPPDQERKILVVNLDCHAHVKQEERTGGY